MKAAAGYGLLFGFTSGLLTNVAPQPWGGILLWGFLALQSAAMTIVLLRRTRLPFASLSCVIATIVSAMAALLYGAGYDLFTFPLPWAAFFWTGFFVIPIVLYVDKFVNPDQWQAWRRHMDECSTWDIFQGHHIPDLRSHPGQPS